MSIIGNPFLLFLTSDNKSKQIVAVNYSRHIIFSRFLTAKGNTMQLTVVPNDNVTDGANVYSASMDVLNEHNPFNGSQNDDNGNLVTTTVTNIDADGTYTLSADSPINGKRVLTMSADEIASRQQASQPQTEEETAPQTEQKTQFQEQTEQQKQQRNEYSIKHNIGDKITVADYKNDPVTITITGFTPDGNYTIESAGDLWQEGNGNGIIEMNDEDIDTRIQRLQQGQQSVQTEQQGEQDYETMQPEQAFDKLVADMGGATIAVPIATAQMEQAKAELDKLQKKAPKLSGTPAEMKQALSEHNAKIADAQRKLDAWTAINAVWQQRRADEQKRIREENDRKQAEASVKAVAELEEQKKQEAEKQAEQDYRNEQGNGAVKESLKRVLSASSLKWSKEKAKNGEPFLIGENGNINLVDIPQEVFDKIGIKKSPFRLTPSMVAHVLERHDKELKLSSPEDAVNAILMVMNNFDHVRKGENNTFIFSVEGSRTKSARRAVAFELEYDKGQWIGIKTLGYDKVSNLKELTSLWEKGENNTSATGVATANVSSDQPLLGNQTDGIASNQKDVNSGSKDSELLQKSKEDAGENKKPRLEKADSKTTEVSSTDALLRDALADVMRESGIEVITDNNEVQRVLDRENKKTPLIGQPNRANEKPTSGSVLASIRRDSSSNPTTSKQASAKVKNDTQSAKNKIKKYFNGDFLISKTDVNKAFADFGKMFAMQDKGGSRYSILQTNSGKTIAIRISNHTAKGDNFKQDNADSNLSIVIEQYKYDNATDSNVEYTEVTIPYEAYRNKPTEVIDAIVNGVNDTLADKEFSLSSELGTVEKKGGEQANTGNKNVRFFRTANGEAYGFTVDGKIYLDPTIAGAETAIHEYTHLWATALKNANPKEWSNIVSLMKGTPLWEKVASEYPELTTNDELADEVLAHYSGKRGAEKLRKEAESITNGKGSLLDKAGAISALERVKEALTRFWKATADLLHIHFTTAEEVADKVLADLLNGVNPNEVAKDKNLRFQLIGEQGAEESTSGDDLEEMNARFNEELQQQIDGTLPQGHIYQLGMASAVLQSAGLPNLPIELSASRLKDKSKQEEHPFELSEMRGLVDSVQNPLAVFRSATHIGSFVVLTEIEHQGKNFVVAIQANRRQGRIEINSIRSVHYRNKNTHIANWITEGLLEYADKKRMAEWLSKQRYNSADVRKLFNHATKIVNEFDNPIINEENLFRKPIGGNSGYVGYSMSKRAEQAREDGRFPKTDFKREYKVSESSLQALSRIGIISDNEWHHTSSYGNKTTFYGWADEAFAEYYLEHKKEIDKATDDLLRLKEEDIDKYFSALDDFRKEMRKSFDVGTSGLSKSKYDFEQELRSRTSDEVVAEYQRQKSEYTSTESNPKPFPSILKWQSQNKDLVKEIENKVRQEMDQSSAIVDSVMSLAGKLHLDNVEIVTDASALSGKEAKAKGFYTKSTGKITIVIPNNTSVEDAVQTLLHEAVAHYGLRKLWLF